MVASRIAALISKTLPEETDHAVQLIVALTGENPAKLAKMSKEDLFMYLSFLLKCEKDKVQSLLREHDQNTELDAASLAKLWKLVAKHSIPDKKKQFGSLEAKTYEHLKIRMSQINDRITKKIELGEALENTSIQILRKAAAQINMQRIIHRLSMSIANSNSPNQVTMGQK